MHEQRELRWRRVGERSKGLMIGCVSGYANLYGCSRGLSAKRTRRERGALPRRAFGAKLAGVKTRCLATGFVVAILLAAACKSRDERGQTDARANIVLPAPLAPPKSEPSTGPVQESDAYPKPSKRIDKSKKDKSMNIPPGFKLVHPVDAASLREHSAQHASAAPPAAQLQIGHTQFFSYVLPPGWRLGENGQFAFALQASDNKAFTALVGNAGLLPGADPVGFVYSKLGALGAQNLQLSQPQPTRPLPGFHQAYTMLVQYYARGELYRGVATCQIYTYYGGSLMAMTNAISVASQWEGYSKWLPQIALQVSNSGAAFGAPGVMQQNLQNSIALRDAAAKYREWSQENWQRTVDEREHATQRQHAEFRDNLEAVQTYDNPYGNSRTVELSTQYRYYWTNKQGQFLGTNDPSDNPNQGSTAEWELLQKTLR